MQVKWPNGIEYDGEWKAGLEHARIGDMKGAPVMPGRHPRGQGQADLGRWILLQRCGPAAHMVPMVHVLLMALGQETSSTTA